VVHVQQQHVLFLTQAQRGGPREWTTRQVEGPPCLLDRQSSRLGFPLRLGKPPQVHHRQRHRQHRRDDLNWPSFHRLKGCPQGFVAPHDLVEALL